MKPPSVYILVNHGSRDLAQQKSLDLLIEQIKREIKPEKIFLETASLELGTISLAEQIEILAQQALVKSIVNVKILPLFLLPGVHVREDLPLEIAKAQKKLSSEVSLELLPYLGSYASLTKLLEKCFQQLSVTSTKDKEKEKRLLIAHGSRLTEGNQPVNTIAKELKSELAYWSIEPHLETTVTQMIAERVGAINIVPYFILAGGITKSLEKKVEDLKVNYPAVQFRLSPPLSSTKELASLIAKEILK